MGGVLFVMEKTKKVTPEMIEASGLGEEFQRGKLKETGKYSFEMVRQNKTVLQSEQKESQRGYTDAGQSGLNCGCFAAGMVIYNHLAKEISD